MKDPTNHSHPITAKFVPQSRGSTLQHTTTHLQHTATHLAILRLVGSLKYRSLLQKSPIKETIYCKRTTHLPILRLKAGGRASTLQQIATQLQTLQHHCNTTATHCNTHAHPVPQSRRKGRYTATQLQRNSKTLQHNYNCNTLQHTCPPCAPKQEEGEVLCNRLQHNFKTLQHNCNTTAAQLQHNTPAHPAPQSKKKGKYSSFWSSLKLHLPYCRVSESQMCVAACCNVLRCVAACCSVLQRVAVFCSVLQGSLPYRRVSESQMCSTVQHHLLSHPTP